MNSDIYKLFFELIQVAVGNRDGLSRVPTAGEWLAIYDESEKQAIIGVMVAGLERLPKEQRPEQELLLQWIGISEQTRHGNLSLTKRCKQLQRKVSELGHKSSILKGQGVALYYDEPLRDLRQSGDIDIFVGCGLKGTMEVARQLGIEEPRWDYKHLHLDIFEDAEVEMHYRVEVMLNLRKNRVLQKWFKNHEEEIFDTKDFKQSRIRELENTGHTENTKNTERLVTPTVEFNVFYILLHIYRHFLYEGVGMRQLMDYYFVLKKSYLSRIGELENSTNQTNYAFDAIKEFEMERFAKGVMWVMQEVFALDRKHMIAEPLESEGRFILNEVMTGGNFGHYDERINKRHNGKLFTVMAICKHNWHLLWHYPSEIIWPPVWFVWHKCWKIRTQRNLK